MFKASCNRIWCDDDFLSFSYYRKVPISLSTEKVEEKKKKKGKEQGQNLAISPKRNPNFQYLADVDFENPAFGSLNSWSCLNFFK